MPSGLFAAVKYKYEILIRFLKKPLQKFVIILYLFVFEPWAAHVRCY